MEKDTRPLPLASYLMAGAMIVAVLLGFALVLREDLQRSRVIDVTKYTEQAPRELMWQLTEGGGGEVITLDGYVFMQGEIIQWWKNAIVLYDTQNEEYRKLSTTIVCREELRNVGNDGINQSYGGIAALVRVDELEWSPARYEICILYETNHHSILAHTGQMLKGGTA